MMKYKDFSDSIATELRRRFPGKNAITRRIDKLDRSYSAIILVDKEPGIAPAATPCIDVDYLYNCYMSGRKMSEIFDMAAELAMKRLPEVTNESFDLSKLSDNLVIRLCDAASRKSMLDNAPHRIIEDLAITYHIFLHGDNGYYTTMIDNKLLEHIGVSEEELHKAAVESSVKEFPARLVPMHELVVDGLLRSVEESECTMENDNLMEIISSLQNRLYVLTNSANLQGASAMFYPGQLDTVASLLGAEKLTILPSSKNEVIIIPDSTDDMDHLKSIVSHMNSAEVAPDERLSDSVYCFDAASSEFYKVV